MSANDQGGEGREVLRLALGEVYGEPEGFFDRQERIAGWSQERLRRARVMVVGAGAIGNEVLKNLALLGVGYLFVVDFDTIAPSNLSRTVLFRPEDVGQPKAMVAAARVRELCLEPGARVDAYHGDMVWELGTGVFRAMDLVLGCVDNVEARLAINRQCHLADVPWIDAGILELAGHVVFFQPRESACYRCSLTRQQLARSRERYSCDDFKRRAFQAGEAPTVQVTSALVAALQVQEAAKYLCGLPVQPGVRLHFQGTLNELMAVRMTRVEECPAHFEYPPPAELDLAGSTTLRQLLEEVGAPERSGPGASLDLRSERGFVMRVRCRGCSQWVELGKPRFAVYATDAWCEACAAQGESDIAPEVSSETEELSLFRPGETPDEVLDRTLEQIGIPLLGVLPVCGASGEYRYYELTGDRSRLLPGIFAAQSRAASLERKERSDGGH
ncbi:MAG: ThiF family adenylyltransferase [Acidobacteriota bacterium]|nr:ThiF family adenylyltransferase [Acidobacteriota bacterium]